MHTLRDDTPHTAQSARQAAMEYLQSGALPGVLGAFCIGSSALLPPDTPLSAHSDFDVMAVLPAGEAPVKPGKLRYHGVLLEISVMCADELRDYARAADDYHLANCLRDERSVLYDPQGLIAPACRYVARDFAAPARIRRRAQNARSKAESALLRFDVQAPSPARLNGWLFPGGIFAQVLLVAALQNPTVRTRYAKAREVLACYGFAAEYEQLLALSGFEGVTRAQARESLSALEAAFDDAACAGKTPFFFSSDLSPAAKPLSIGGSGELIEAGLHREAMFWIAATFARCETVFLADAPALYEKHHARVQALRALLGVPTPAQEQARAQSMLDFLPALDALTEAIISRQGKREEAP